MFKPNITKEEINSMQVISFNGKITIIDDLEKIEPTFEELEKHSIVGIDTETKPSFKKGKTNNVSLVQIATPNECFLFRINTIGIPEKLVRFLTNKNIKKVGLALRDDFSKLNKHQKIKPENIIDLQNIVKNYGIISLSLQKIYAIVFNKKISKSQQLSNWENEQLTEPQQRYAATDAWACLEIYQQLMQEKTLSKKEIEEIQQGHTILNN